MPALDNNYSNTYDVNTYQSPAYSTATVSYTWSTTTSTATWVSWNPATNEFVPYGEPIAVNKINKKKDIQLEFDFGD